jgi:hypothetical protein
MADPKPLTVRIDPRDLQALAQELVRTRKASEGAAVASASSPGGGPTVKGLLAAAGASGPEAALVAQIATAVGSAVKSGVESAAASYFPTVIAKLDVLNQTAQAQQQVGALAGQAARLGVSVQPQDLDRFAASAIAGARREAEGRSQGEAAVLRQTPATFLQSLREIPSSAIRDLQDMFRRFGSSESAPPARAFR